MKAIYEQISLIAHRGLCSKYYENTLPAFIHACKTKFYGIETDIQFTKDNKIICFHDKTTNRLIGEKKRISDLNCKELLKKSINNRVDVDKKSNICTFDKYLKICKKYQKHCIIEIKYRMNNQQINSLIKSIKTRKYLHHCIIISFNPHILRCIRNKEPDIRLQLLIRNPIRRYLNFCQLYKIDVSIYDKLITKEVVSKLKSSGLQVAAWTVNDVKAAQRLVNAGVTFITSDHLI